MEGEYGRQAKLKSRSNFASYLLDVITGLDDPRRFGSDSWWPWWGDVQCTGNRKLIRL